MTDTSIAMNRHAIVDLVLYAPVEKAEILFQQLWATVKRLRLMRAAARSRKAADGGAFKVPPVGIGGWPCLHDVMRWLDSLKKGTKHADDVKFLLRLFNTCHGRVRPAVIEELEKGASH